MEYSTMQLASHFNVSRSTIVNWTNEFAEYLSDNTRPSEGMKRFYTESDVQVFTLVNEMRDRFKFDEIHASLKNADFDSVAFENVQTSQEIVSTRAQVNSLQNALLIAKAEKDELIAQRDALQQKLNRAEVFESLYEKMLAQVIELNRQIERLKLQAGDDES